MSEFRKAGIRIFSNYVRLLASICFGVALVPMLLRIGPDVFSLVSLLTSTASIATIMEEIVGLSMIRELGAAHHRKDPAAFLTMYNSAAIVCAAAAALTLGIFAAILLILPFLQIPSTLMVAARWFVVAKAVECAVLVLLAPQFNMYLVLERMVAYNGWIIAKRASQVLAVVIVIWMKPTDQSSGLVWFGWISMGLHALVMAIAAAAIMAIDRRLRPAPAHATRAGTRSILHVSGWFVTILGSQVLGLPAGNFLMNFSSGLFGNRIFGISTQLAGYARMMASGMTGGIDAVSARLSAGHEQDTGHYMKRLIEYSTRLHGLVAIPGAVFIAILAHPLIVLWVGRNLDPAGAEVATSVVLTRIFVAAFVVMCLGDCWMRVLYGAGHIRKYAPTVVLGGFVNVGLALALMTVLPVSLKYAAVAIAFTSVYLVFHFGFVPGIVARSFELSYWEVVEPLARPLIATVLASPVLLAYLWSVQTWTIWWLLIASLSFGVAYALLTWTIVLRRQERERLAAAIAQIKVARLLVARSG